MTFDDICAILVHPPFNYRFREIAELTYYQIQEILGREVDEEGRVQLKGPRTNRVTLTDPYAIFVHSMRMRLKEDGSTYGDDEIAALWREQRLAALGVGASDCETPEQGPMVNDPVATAGAR